MWIALYDYMKMYEWLLGVEKDTYLSIMYFLLCLDYEESHNVLNEMMKPMLVNAYSLSDDNLSVIAYMLIK